MPNYVPDVQRHYHPDPDAMVNALARILRFKPPDRNNKTISDSLVGDALMVSEQTAKPTTGEADDQLHDPRS